MKKTKSTIVFAMLIAMAALISCASTELQYRYFVLRSKEQKLNAKDPKDDLPLSICDDTPESKAQCYVIRRDEFSKILRDLAEKDQRLKACEKQ